ncbi:IucC family-domain-containing protein [Blastocladiella britannica]|nr:IucC family-domain-containing protein [Blastocladiella britannica]
MVGMGKDFDGKRSWEMIAIARMGHGTFAPSFARTRIKYIIYDNPTALEWYPLINCRICSCPSHNIFFPKSIMIEYQHHARFATNSRLLCALANEKLVDFRLESNGTVVVLVPCPSAMVGSVCANESIRVPCRPVPTSHQLLLDPSKLIGPVTIVGQEKDDASDPCVIWLLVADRWFPVDKAVAASIAAELASSVAHQAEVLYEAAAARPSPTLADSSALDWEHALVEGHATHPMHRSRVAHPTALPPIDPVAGHRALTQPRLHYVLVPRAPNMVLSGTWETDVHPYLAAQLGVTDDDAATHWIVPVHELQVPWIRAQYTKVRWLETSTPCIAQASTRTVAPAELAFPEGAHAKLPLFVTITSALRGVGTNVVVNGPVMTAMAHAMRDVRPSLGPDPIDEFAGIGTVGAGEMGRGLACVLRHDPDSAELRAQGERLVPAAALVERDVHENVAHVYRIFPHLKEASAIDRRQWFTDYAARLVAGVIGDLVQFGWGWEAHGQNTLVRISIAGDIPRVIGFRMRDFGGCRVHPLTWRKAFSGSAATELVDQLLPGSFQIANDLRSPARVVYHTVFGTHLPQLARALGVFHDPLAWAAVRDAIRTATPEDDQHKWLIDEWMGRREVEVKGLLRMKIEGGGGADYVYCRVPNVLRTADEQEKM